MVSDTVFMRDRPEDSISPSRLSTKGTKIPPTLPHHRRSLDGTAHDKMPTPHTTPPSRRPLHTNWSTAKGQLGKQAPATPPAAAGTMARYPITPHNRRLPMRSPLSATKSVVTWQDFAPRSPAKKHNFTFSPETSPHSASSISPVASPSAAEDDDHLSAFTVDDANRLDNDDRARHEALRAQHRAEIDQLIRRSESRHGNRTQEAIKGRKTDSNQPVISQQARGTPTSGSSLRRTGAALLEYRRNQKTEILARQAARHSEATRTVILDTTLADKTAAIIERQARRRSLTSKRPVSCRSQPSVVASTSYETSGIETSAHIAAVERQRRHTEEVSWACLQMERVLERL